MQVLFDLPKLRWLFHSSQYQRHTCQDRMLGRVILMASFDSPNLLFFIPFAEHYSIIINKLHSSCILKTD